MVDPSGRKQRGTKEPFHEGEEESKKTSLMRNIQKTKITVSSPITSLQIDGGKSVKHWQTFFSCTPKSLQTMTAAKKLKDDCSLQEKLWQFQTAYSKAETSLWWKKSV